MISRLQEIYLRVRDEIHNAVLLCEAPRPRAGRKILKRLRLADSGEWVAHDSLYEI